MTTSEGIGAACPVRAYCGIHPPNLARNGRGGPGLTCREPSSERLWVSLAVLAIVAVALFIVSAERASLLGDVANLALVLTFLALVRYAYDPYRMAELSAVPSASFGFIRADRSNRPLLLNSLPRNHSRVPIRCWCNVHAKVLDTEIDVEGFYGGKAHWNLQPFQEPRGVLDLERLLDSVPRSVDDLSQAWSSAENADDKHNVLRLDVEFWYQTLDGRFHSPRFWEGYYFDFDKNALALHPQSNQ